MCSCCACRCPAALLARTANSPHLHISACLPPSPGGGRKKLKRREREALLQQHGIALAGQLKSQAGGEQQAGCSSGAGAGVGPGADGSSGPASQERPAAAVAAAEGAPPPPPPDQDDDIFGDAGTDYVPTVKDKERMQQKAAAAAEAARRGGYFGGREYLHADLPPLPKDGGRVGQQAVCCADGGDAVFSTDTQLPLTCSRVAALATGESVSGMFGVHN